MITLDKKGDTCKGTTEKGNYKDVSKLKNIAKEKGIKREDILLIKNYNEKYTLNSIARQELVKKNIIRWPEDNRCYFFDGNRAYVSWVKETENYLYCSVNPNTNEIFYLNAIDIFYILSNKSDGETETEMFRVLGINTTEEETKQEFRDTYLTNIEVANDIDILSSEYPNFYKSVKSTLNTYKVLNEIGIKHVTGIESSVDGRPVFYVGATDVSKLNGRGESTTRNHINMLALLGLIIKLDDYDIPEYMLNKLNRASKGKNKRDRTNCYMIPRLTPELLESADKKALKARENNLSLKNIGLEKIEEVFGNEMLSVVYEDESKVKKIQRAMDIKNHGRSDISKEDIENVKASKKQIEIEFQVNSIIKRNSDTNYTTANVTILEYPVDAIIPTTNTIVNGYFPIIAENDNFRAIGIWRNMGNSEYQFVADSTIMTVLESSNGLIEFFHKNIEGIGAITANKIVERFGHETFKVISANPNRLTEIDGIGMKKALKIKEGFEKYKGFEEAHFTLTALGFNSLEILNIYDIYGKDILSKIEEDPYMVSRNRLVSFKKADIIAEKLEISLNDQRRVKGGVLEYIEYNIKNKGNIFVYKDILLNELSDHINRIGAYSEDVLLEKIEIEDAINSLAKDETIAIEKDKDDNICIYSKPYLDMENHIVEIIEKMLKQGHRKIASSIEIKDYLSKKKVASNCQKQAVIMALNNKISILSGGPGSGKTTTAKLVVNTIKEFYPQAKIELTAPTGIAAKRLSDGMDMEAKTIHRLIGLNNFSEDDLELQEIEADFLIIDEASMLDVHLFYNLLSVIGDKTQILIMGDYNQLPSIGPGLVLRDLIESKIVPHIVLEELYRQESDSKIIENADKIIKGDKDINLEDGNGFFFVNTKKKSEIQNNIINNIQNCIELGYKLNEIQVISPIKKGSIGVLALNRLIQDNFNPKKRYETEISIGMDKTFRHRDKVMQTVNNYNLGVFNGEVGEILYVGKTANVMEVAVDFGNKEIIYTNENLNELTLAYATTIHKSQGLEFNVVIMPIHNTQSLPLDRNLIYTAWTRAKEKLVCIGDKDELYKSMDRAGVLERNSLLKDKLICKGEDLIAIPF